MSDPAHPPVSITLESYPGPTFYCQVTLPNTDYWAFTTNNVKTFDLLVTSALRYINHLDLEFRLHSSLPALHLIKLLS